MKRGPWRADCESAHISTSVPTPPATPAPDVVLLAEIRDLLKQQAR